MVGLSKTQPSQRRLPNDGLCHNRDALWDADGSRPRSRFRRRTHHLRRRARVAGRGGFGAGLVRGHLRTRAGVEEEARAPLPGVAREAAPLADSVRLRGPGRRGLLARRPLAQALLRLLAPERGGTGQPAHPLAHGERGHQALLPSDSRGALRTLPERTRLGWRPPAQGALLDLDSSADPTHGDQEGSYYHGY